MSEEAEYNQLSFLNYSMQIVLIVSNRENKIIVLYCTSIRVQIQWVARTEDDEHEDERGEDGGGDEHPVEARGGPRERVLAACVGLVRGAVGRERTGRQRRRRRRDCGALHWQSGDSSERSGARGIGESGAPLEELLELGHQLRRNQEPDRHAQLCPKTRRTSLPSRV